MEKAKLMLLEIEKKRKLPKHVKETISTDIFQNLVAAIIVMAYLVTINIIYYTVQTKVFEEYMKYLALGLISITVITFELAYRKSSLKFCFIGIELLACGILSLYIPYIYLHTTQTLRNGIMILPACLLIYYTVKSFLIFKQKQFQYQNNLSDVKELVKETEKASYLDEESYKSYRAKTQEEEKIRQELAKEQKIRRKKKELEKNKKIKMSKNKK